MTSPLLNCRTAGPNRLSRSFNRCHGRGLIVEDVGRPDKSGDQGLQYELVLRHIQGDQGWDALPDLTSSRFADPPAASPGQQVKKLQLHPAPASGNRSTARTAVSSGQIGQLRDSPHT